MNKWLSSARLVRWSSWLALIAVCVCAALACNAARPRLISASRGDVGKPDRATLAYRWQEKNYPPVSVTLPKIEGAEMVKDDALCMTCHESYTKYHQTNIHREQSCESCHGPGSVHIRSRGKDAGSILSFKTMSPAQRSETCLQCHEQNQCTPGAKWRTSAHAHEGVACTDCHKGHYNVPAGTPATKVASTAADPVIRAAFQAAKTPPADMEAIRSASRSMGAAGSQTCFRCHQQEAELQRVAHPHQLMGTKNFECATCHDPHAKIRPETRTDLCLQCHKGHPSMAWNSSSHALNGVACVDCHNPHPRTDVPRFANIQHTHVERVKRLPMSVQEPDTCYRCHQKTAAQFALPSHHPLPEGKMKCSSCHDSHGGAERNLKEATVNLVCYRCHAEKQGPFVWEHPPVTENCGICHNPHGAVANNLLHQPTTFLCLRCHAGHRGQRRNIDKEASIRPAFFTDCSQCHSQVHGSDLPAATRRGPRLTR